MIFKIIPQMLENTIIVRTIKRFSFRWWFCLNSTNIPTPEPHSKPAIQLPKVITFSKYSSVIMTLEAQLGINPIRLMISGDSILLFSVKVIIISLSIMEFRKMLIIKIKKVIFKVWKRLDFKILSSQWQCSSSHKLWISFLGVFRFFW